MSVVVHDYSMVVGGAWAESESGGCTDATSPATDRVRACAAMERVAELS